MKVLCAACEGAAATVFCTADSRALCGACDARTARGGGERVALAPPAGGMAMCDICQSAEAHFFCMQDRSLMCRACDKGLHSKGGARKHGRYLVPGVCVPPLEEAGAGGGSADAGAPARNGTAVAAPQKQQQQPQPQQQRQRQKQPQLQQQNGRGGAGASAGISGMMGMGSTYALAGQQQRSQLDHVANMQRLQGQQQHVAQVQMMPAGGAGASGSRAGTVPMGRQVSLGDPLQLDELLGLQGLAENGYTVQDVMVPKNDADPDGYLFEGLADFDDEDLMVPGYDPNAIGALSSRGYSGFPGMPGVGVAGGSGPSNGSFNDDGVVPDFGASGAASGGARGTKRQRGQGLGLAQALSSRPRR